MFVETIDSERDEWEQWEERLGLGENPPDGLVLHLVWDAGGGRVGQLNVWDTPDKVSDFYVERARHVIAELGEPKGKPHRHGSALVFFMRAAE